VVRGGQVGADDRDPLLDVRDLRVTIESGDRTMALVDGVSFSLGRSEVLGLIGESGCGKSMTALAMLRLLPPAARLAGEIRFGGTDLTTLSERDMKRLRGSEMSMIFQEPMTALDPVFTIGQQITEALRSHSAIGRRAARAQALDMLRSVGIPDPVRRFDEYPHQLSGGMRQRSLIAMALVCSPALLIADEPTTAVDITIQAQILELLRKLNRERGTAILFITHDIGVIAEICDRVLVMYAGQVVEASAVDDLLESPAHPYTSGLMWAVPRSGRRRERLKAIGGRVPEPGQVPRGCRFHPRCEFCRPSCTESEQIERPAGDPSHLVRCERADELTLPGIHDRWSEPVPGRHHLGAGGS
jgi:peptide/nickel transport system ATP-binding protein